jgi:hypothetical protein
MFSISSSASGRLYEPVKTQVALGRITPMFGRTQYLFGEVVLTWSKHQSVIEMKYYSIFIMSNNKQIH